MKILLLEDHPIFRLGVRQLISQRWPDADIVESESLADALKQARADGLQLALVDLNLPDANGLECVSQLRRAAPYLRLLVLSQNAETAYATRVLQLGAAGYLAKDRAPDELIIAIERVMAGGRYISSSLAEQLANLMTGTAQAAPHDGLSAQEYRVMLLLAAGRRVSEIGELMHLSPKTVSTYRARILEKLAVDSNVGIARYCMSHGLKDDSL
ncbi:MAG: response regulator transcription factor [Zoogloea sp.]|nr:response regulator transcription factor [Zoogloea sp.]